MKLTTLQKQFTSSLLTPAIESVPDGFTQYYSPDERLARFAVYRNNVFASLHSVLEGVYPKVKQVVGDAFFKQLTTQFISQQPPKHAALVGFGAGLRHFINNFPPAQSLPYLGDLAHYEWLSHTAYYAADASSLSANHFASWDNSILATARVRFQPSTALLCSPHAIFTLYRYLDSDDSSQGSINIGKAENMLIVRPRHEVNTVILEGGNFSFFEALIQGATITQALTGAAEEHSLFEPAAAFALLIGSESVIDIIGDSS